MRIWLLAAFLLNGWLIGCGSTENTLDGSLGNQIDLHFSDVRAYLNGRSLVIIYERHTSFPARVTGIGPNFANQVLRLTLNGLEETITANQDLTLVPDLEHFFGDLEHYCLSDSENSTLVQDPPLPDLVGGSIHFTNLHFYPGENIKGYFAADLSDGSKVNAKFDTDLVAP